MAKRTHKRGRKAPPRMTDELARKIGGLTSAQLDELEAEPIGPIRRGGGKTGNPVVRRKVIGGLVYQLEFRQCGTSTCRCMKTSDPRAGWHGPYWYGYTSATRLGGDSTRRGRWVSTYIGREFHELG